MSKDPKDPRPPPRPRGAGASPRADRAGPPPLPARGTGARAVTPVADVPEAYLGAKVGRTLELVELEREARNSRTYVARHDKRQGKWFVVLVDASTPQEQVRKVVGAAVKATDPEPSGQYLTKAGFESRLNKYFFAWQGDTERKEHKPPPLPKREAPERPPPRPSRAIEPQLPGEFDEFPDTDEVEVTTDSFEAFNRRVVEAAKRLRDDRDRFLSRTED